MTFLSSSLPARLYLNSKTSSEKISENCEKIGENIEETRYFLLSSSEDCQLAVIQGFFAEDFFNCRAIVRNIKPFLRQNITACRAGANLKE